ncbi:hypothetical protein EMMF5_004718 [Cystobasidiomycetes sp. EMM_F5]
MCAILEDVAEVTETDDEDEDELDERLMEEDDVEVAVADTVEIVDDVDEDTRATDVDVVLGVKKDAGLVVALSAVDDVE